MSIPWQATLTAMQSTVNFSTQPQAIASEGSALITALQNAAAVYSSLGNDGPSNKSSYAASFAAWATAAAPLWQELDRCCRFVLKSLGVQSTQPGANSAPPAWYPSTYYKPGSVVQAGGVLVVAIGSGGTTGATMPSFATTVTATTADGSVLWQTIAGTVYASLALQSAGAFGLGGIQPWKAWTNYQTGAAVTLPSPNGFTYMASVGGVSNGAQSNFPTVLGATVQDGGITWTCTAVAGSSTTAVALPFDSSLAALVSLNARYAAVVGSAGSVGASGLLATAYQNWQTQYAALPAPSPLADAASTAAINALNTAVQNCQAWLAAASFT